MSTSDFPRLFSPASIGRVTIKNRLVMAPMDLENNVGGYISEQAKQFFVNRAQSGVGLIIIGCLAVEDRGALSDNSLRLDDDLFIEGLKDLTEVLHPYGVKVFGQLFHAGRDAMNSYAEPIAPSAVKSRLSGRLPRELNLQEIDCVVENFATAAQRAKEGGLDGVEILGSSGFLISQFMSPVTNRRTDEYGGSLENRLRLAMEIIAAVRSRVGSDYPIIFRHTGDDYIEGGHRLEDAREVARRLAQAGVDAIDVQVGWEEAPVPTSWMIVPPGAFSYLAGVLKQTVDVPVIACNRIHDPLTAEKILAEGQADFIAMARPFIADPEFAVKAQTGCQLKIRKCLACNQGCLDRVFAGRSVKCLVNPAVGMLSEMRVEPALIRKNVVVVGGGPAGMEAARVLAMRGHKVKIFEKGAELGGQLRLVGAIPHKERFTEFVEYLKFQLNELGVQIKLGLEVSKEHIIAEKPDVVVIATGTNPIMPRVPGIDGANVMLAQDVLAENVIPGRRVVVVGAHGTGCNTAIFLATKGAVTSETRSFLRTWRAVTPEQEDMWLTSRQITLIDKIPRIADDLGKTSRWIVMQELRDHKVNVIPQTTLEEITGEGIIVSKDGAREFIAADSVVIAVGGRPSDRLYRELEGEITEVYLIGDAKQVGDAGSAVEQGLELASFI